MALWRQLVHGLRTLVRRSAADQEIDDEIEHYLNEAIAEHMARGIPHDQAVRVARRHLGSPVHVREQVREYGWENAVESLLADLRHAGRRLRAEPGFTAITALTLALGIGAATAIFSVVKPLLLERLPYPGADRMAVIWELGRDGAYNASSFGMYRELAARAVSLEALAVVKPWQPTMIGPHSPERFTGQRATASYFDVVGVTPAIGRAFNTGEDRLHGAGVVVISDGLWRRRFGADPNILGRPMTLDGGVFTIIGVMPPGFENPLRAGVELWAPLQYDLSQGRAWGHHLDMYARLRPGVSPARAASELGLLGRVVLDEFRPTTYGSDVRFILVPLQEELTQGVRPALLAILGAVALLLVISCANVSNLLLGRVGRRRGEFALRTALGAGSARLVRQLTCEGLLLALLGGLTGMGLAVLAVRLLRAVGPADLPRAAAMQVDLRVFAFGLALTTLVGLLCAAMPALRAARTDPRAALQGTSSRSGTVHHPLRSGLVVAEVALALVLLVSASLLLRSLQRLLSVDPGFEPSHLLTLQVQTSGPQFQAEGSTQQFFADALDAVRRVPGITAAALTSQLPLSGDQDLYGVHFDPPVSGDPGEIRGSFRYAVSPGYFEAMGILLRSGRLFEETDRAGAPLVAVVGEALARRRLPGGDPLGRRVRIGTGPLYTVVGVVGNVRQISLALGDSDAVYVPAAQWRFADDAMSLVVRARDDAAALAAPVRDAVWSVDKDQPVVRLVTMDALVAASAAEPRFAWLVFELFALAAGLLAAVGMYGVLADRVSERTREIGLRSALGAARGDILRLVFRQGMALAALGLLIGAAAAVVATQALVGLLFEVSHLDAATYVIVTALLAAVAATACIVPAWRATRVDPATALRAE